MRCDTQGSQHHSIANPCFGPSWTLTPAVPRSTGQPHCRSTAKVTLAKVWGSLRVVSSQENDCLSEVGRIPKTVYDLTC